MPDYSASRLLYLTGGSCPKPCFGWHISIKDIGDEEVNILYGLLNPVRWLGNVDGIPNAGSLIHITGAKVEP
jgi:hypothetical protein